MLSGLLLFCVYVSYLMLFELLPVHFVCLVFFYSLQMSDSLMLLCQLAFQAQTGTRIR